MKVKIDTRYGTVAKVEAYKDRCDVCREFGYCMTVDIEESENCGPPICEHCVTGLFMRARKEAGDE